MSATSETYSDCSFSDSASSEDVSVSMIPSSSMLFGCPFALKLGHVFCCNEKRRYPRRQELKMMRQYIFTLDESDADVVLFHLKPQLGLLFEKSYGSLLVRDLITRASRKALLMWLDDINVVTAIQHQYGSLTFECLLNSGDYAKSLLKNFNKCNFYELATNFWGNYTIQRVCALLFSPEEIELLVEMMAPHAPALSIHPNGAFVFQKAMKKVHLNFDRCSEKTKKLAENILQSVVKMGHMVIADCHGNFSVQQIIPVLHRFPEIEAQLVAELEQNLWAYCDSKSGTRVVEKMLQVGTDESKNTLVQAMVKMGYYDFRDLYYTGFGYFAIEKAINVANPSSWEWLTQQVRRIVAEDSTQY